MKHLIYLCTLLLSFSALAQQRLEITHIADASRTIAFVEGTRVKVRTSDMKKHVGELRFTADGKLSVDGAEFPVDSITSIKKQTKAFSTLKNVVLITGLAVMGGSLIVAATGGEAALLLFTTGTGLTIGSAILEATNPNYTKRKWTYQISGQ